MQPDTLFAPASQPNSLFGPPRTSDPTGLFAPRQPDPTGLFVSVIRPPGSLFAPTRPADSLFAAPRQSLLAPSSPDGLFAPLPGSQPHFMQLQSPSGSPTSATPSDLFSGLPRVPSATAFDDEIMGE